MNLNYCMITASTLLLAASLVHAQDEKTHSGLFIEPAITYEVGTAEVNYPSPLSNSSGSADGFGLGAKFGFHISEVVFLALDARYSKPQYKDSSVNYDSESVSTNWGPVVGIQMPNFGLRVWANAILGGELNPESSGGFDVTFKEATGYRIGAGLRLASLSLNLEYQDSKYDKTTLQQLGPFTPGSTLNGVDLENKSWIVSVSFPLEL
jgi:Outer membrane protein beta-barrel domain